MRCFRQDRRNQNRNDAQPIGKIIQDFGDDFRLAFFHQFPRRRLLNEAISFISNLENGVHRAAHSNILREIAISFYLQFEIVFASAFFAASQSTFAIARRHAERAIQQVT